MSGRGLLASQYWCWCEEQETKKNSVWQQEEFLITREMRNATFLWLCLHLLWLRSISWPGLGTIPRSATNTFYDIIINRGIRDTSLLIIMAGESSIIPIEYLLTCILQNGCYFSGQLLSPGLGADLLYLESPGSNILLLDCNLDTELGVTDQKQTSDDLSRILHSYFYTSYFQVMIWAKCLEMIFVTEALSNKLNRIIDNFQRINLFIILT